MISMSNISRRNLCLLTGSTVHPAVARNVPKYLGVPLTQVKTKQFGVGELCPKILKSIRGKEAFVLATANTGRIHDDLWETYALLHAISLASVRDIHLFMLAMPYQRQDRKDEPRVPITAELAIRLLRQSARGQLRSLITFDPHTIAAEAIMSAHDIPSPAALTTRSLFVEYIKKNLPLNKLILVAPDSGRVKWVRSWAKAIYGPEEFIFHYLPAEKVEIGGEKRVFIHERPIDMMVGKKRLHGKVNLEHNIALIVDDMIDGGGTVISAAVELAKRSPAYILANAVHGYLSGDAPENLQSSPIDQVIVTNTLNIPDISKPDNLTELDVSPLIGEIIHRIATNKSLEGYNLKV